MVDSVGQFIALASAGVPWQNVAMNAEQIKISDDPAPIKGRVRRFWTRDLGSVTSRDAANATRILLALIALNASRGGMLASSSWPFQPRVALIAFLIVSICAFVSRVVSWKLDARLRAVMAMADQAICLLTLAAYPQTVAIYLPFVTFVLGVSLRRSDILWVALDYLLLATIIAFHNRLAALFPTLGIVSDDVLRLQFTLVTGTASAVMAFKAAQWGARIADRWNGELLDTAAHARALPIANIAAKLALRFDVSSMLICWQQEGDRAPECYRFSAGKLSEGDVELSTLEQMLAPDTSGNGFIWNSKGSRALVDAQSWFGASVRTIDLAFLPIEEGEPSNVAALPIRTSALQGYIYLLGIPRISEQALDQIVGASRAVSATLDRYLMFEAWRERAFANARLDLSRDMHDSVLQTLAGLRLQVAALIKDTELPVATRTERLESLQSIIAAEQACLRELVADANLPIGEKIDLASHLTQRVELLSRQWGIACALSADPAPLWVSPDVAVEVEFLVREAVSNAVQHAKSSRVEVIAAQREDELFITLKSDGASALLPDIGASNIEGVRSRSLTRRLKALNGRAYADSIERGVLLSIRIPLEVIVDVPPADR
ncbi:sensor histidine kinase [Sphingomonas panacisoli]|uniref:sensor histidine kinase n=1 Tax=Sphingomonas panacisoli TaxID=1813879 RepID=UPI001646F4E3|nr:histidine kinase [Sphingomonas panacisoli]